MPVPHVIQKPGNRRSLAERRGARSHRHISYLFQTCYAGNSELSSTGADYACSSSGAWLGVVGPKARGRGSGERVGLAAPKCKQWEGRRSKTPVGAEPLTSRPLPAGLDEQGQARRASPACGYPSEQSGCASFLQRCSSAVLRTGARTGQWTWTWRSSRCGGSFLCISARSLGRRAQA